MRLYKKVFNDKVKRAEMLKMRLSGYSLNEIAEHYQVHHTSILEWCQKYKVYPTAEQQKEIHARALTKRHGGARTPLPIIRIKIPEHKYAHILYEQECPGKTYADYLKKPKTRLELIVGL